nr:NrfD/PsrC family molybdoenzyme membrane anchor subunit [uncultured Massilia sp.]
MSAPSSTDREPPRSQGSEILGAGWSYAGVSDEIADIVLAHRFGWKWWAAFLAASVGVFGLLVALVWLLVKGVGIWGIDMPVAWGFAIANFVWWVGIGHAGTFISAVLLLLRQRWRTSINRFAEAMTLFAASMAGIYPIIHLGRPWFFYWLVPYPNKMDLWPQWRSPLLWDFFAIASYILVSALFWYVGLIPDLATLRDRAGRAGQRMRKVVYGLLALGWRGEARHWERYESAYLLMAGLATPLVVSVHTIVSFDFAVGNTPGYHSTIFPPYFVAGALFSGFAMVLTIAIPLRAAFGLQEFITGRHLANAAKVMIATSWLVGYGYAAEAFTAFYSADRYEQYMTVNRWIGPYAPIYWSMLVCNIVLPQLLWLHRVRHNVLALFVLSLVVNCGMWMERVLIVVSSLHRDYLPSSWGMYYPTFWDWLTLFGTVALFVWLFLLFVRFLPLISIAEMRELVRESAKGEA